MKYFFPHRRNSSIKNFFKFYFSLDFGICKLEDLISLKKMIYWIKWNYVLFGGAARLDFLLSRGKFEREKRQKLQVIAVINEIERSEGDWWGLLRQFQEKCRGISKKGDVLLAEADDYRRLRLLKLHS